MTDQRHALAFNAVGPVLFEHDAWLPLTIRKAVAEAVLEAIDEEPTIEEPQDHPAAELYVRLRKAGEDRDTAQQLIYAHAAMVIRQHKALNGDTAVGQQPATEPLTDAERQFLTFALDLADNRMANRSDEFTAEDYEALARLRQIAAGDPS